MSSEQISYIYEKLASVINKTYHEIGQELLISTDYGIVVYNKYLIRRIANGFEVITRTQTETHEFGSIKNALVWIILHNHIKIPEAKRVKELDGLIHSSDIDTKIHAKMRLTGNTEKYLIHCSKLQQDKEKQKQFLNEIDKYIILAHKCQQMRTTK